MDIAGKIKNFLTKLQSLSEDKKKIILWTIVVIVAVVLGFFWVTGAENNLSKISGSIQKTEIPQINVPNAATSSQNTTNSK